ncbi:MATE family efflux transporter [Leifsonia sp. McL0607]|uniref:MATE family efflux transporter n=1 Tax=Leifsonia sp. McL0607 TaxID=3415672 RepID=UPI003CEF098C
MLAIDSISVGYGVVDMIFVSAFGVAMVAGVGLGDLLTALYLAFFAGSVDVFASRLARRVGAGEGYVWLAPLFRGFLLVAVPWTLIGLLLAVLTPALLEMVGSDPAVVGVASGYVLVRMIGIPFTLTLAAASAALRIFNKRGMSVMLVGIGFVLNIGVDALFLYSPLASFFFTPVAAVASATLVVQVLTGAAGVVLLIRFVRRHGTAERRKPAEGVRGLGLARDMLKTSVGIGLRQLNDYAASVVPFVLISRLDIATIAAATVATRIWTIYCRVPQACLAAAGVYLGYARGASQRIATALMRVTISYVALPSIGAAVLFAVASPLLAQFLGGGDVDIPLTWMLTLCFLIAVPAYVLENLAGEVLTVEQQGKWLSVSSSIVTYAITIPIAIVGVLVLQSAVVAILSAFVASVLLAAVYLRRCRQLGYRVRALPVEEMAATP